MAVIVYFETENHSYAQYVATFESEELYLKMLPELELLCKEQGFAHVTESIETDGVIITDNEKRIFINLCSFVLNNNYSERSCGLEFGELKKLHDKLLLK